MQRKLTDAKIRNLKPRSKGYKSADGGGLYVFTNPKGAKSFRYDFRHHDKYATITFGQHPLVSLAEAREMHEEARKQVIQGEDPRRVKQANQMRGKPFSYYAEEMVTSQDLRPMTANKKLAKM